MIARVWRGKTPDAKADAYFDYLKATGVKDIRATRGNRGVFVLKRALNGEAEFLFVSLWDSMEAIQAFAGPDVDRAVYYQEDAAFLSQKEPRVAHYEVLTAPKGA
jgi:heme-degrading monooxygenase HmoA